MKSITSVTRIFVTKFLLGVIWLYQMICSPFMPKCCRYTPSCSNYAVIAIKRYGVLRGVCISILRVLRCNPFNKNHGYDPVP